MPNLIRAIYDPILKAGGLGSAGSTGGATAAAYKVLPMQLVNTPNSGGAHLGSAYDGGYESYLVATLQQLLGRHPRDGFTRVITKRECAGGPATCHKTVERGAAQDLQGAGHRQRHGQGGVLDRVDRLQGGRPDHAGLRRDPVPGARHRRATGDRLAEPAHVPAGDPVLPAPPALSPSSVVGLGGRWSVATDHRRPELTTDGHCWIGHRSRARRLGG